MIDLLFYSHQLTQCVVTSRSKFRFEYLIYKFLLKGKFFSLFRDCLSCSLNSAIMKTVAISEKSKSTLETKTKEIIPTKVV